MNIDEAPSLNQLLAQLVVTQLEQQKALEQIVHRLGDISALLERCYKYGMGPNGVL